MFLLTGLVELPFGRGKTFLVGVRGIADRIVGGWSLSGTIPGKAACLFPHHIHVLQTVTPVPADPIWSELFTSREAGPATSRPPVVYHFNRMARPETRLDRGSDLLSRPSEARAGIHFAGLASPKRTSPVAKNFSLKTRVSRFNSATDIFNLFNKVNLDNPQTCVDCQSGGTIINTAFGGGHCSGKVCFR